LGTSADLGTGSGATINSYMYGNQGNSSSGLRWVSARVIRCGVKVIPAANLTVKSGVLTMVQVPGSDYSSGVVAIPIPTLNNML